MKKRDRNIQDVKPVWIREWIEDLERQRDVAIRSLNDFCDDQTESRIFYDDFVCTGEKRGPSSKRRYIQSSGVQFDNDGVKGQLFFSVGGGVTIHFGGRDGSPGEVGILPIASNSIRLVNFGQRTRDG